MYTNIYPCRHCGIRLSWDRKTKSHRPIMVGYWDELNDEPAQYRPSDECPRAFGYGKHEPK